MKFVFAAFVTALTLQAQGTLADYQRALDLRKRYETAALNNAGEARWIESSKFWYRRSGNGGHEFILVDAATQAKSPLFDHAKLAAALNAVTGGGATAANLPLQSLDYIDKDKDKTLEFLSGGSRYRCTLSDYVCKPAGPARFEAGIPQNRWAVLQRENKPVPSPDGNQEALIQNHNLLVRPKGAKSGTLLSTDGSEGDYYASYSISWSPDSTRIAVYRVRTGYHRQLTYVESSPADQLQPKSSTIEYAKPGDVLDLQQPVLFHVASKKQIVVDRELFPNPYQLTRPVWWKDGRGFTFEYNQRGHQVYRVIEVDGTGGKPRAIISEEPKTFFCYSSKRYRHDVADGKELVWMSERDGWNHVYLYDGLTGEVKSQITRGEWVVRGVERVDDEKRQIWFQASGVIAGKDPYFVHYYRINFDGSGLTHLTPADANHQVAFSKDYRLYVDTWSRVDHAPVAELRRTEDQRLVAEIEYGQTEALVKAGWKPPEVFVSKGRDDVTDIWGLIYRPSNFDASKKYPVVENIYAGPHGSFVPKSFSPYNPMQSLAELGFIVVQIDGMGTNHRSKAFHDVAWKNLADAGFPDRIRWHKAVAARYGHYDVSRVGIYGTSAGGQSAMGALLFHGDFYKAAVSSCGCHDNRMDKIWWNEQWMGWPVGPEYAACSNVDNAPKLKGKLLLYVGEMDTNVDPSSTLQVVNALIKANKTFDLLVLPGANHTNGGPYGDRKRFDFFVRHLIGTEPPDWNDNARLAASLDRSLSLEVHPGERGSFVE